MIAAIEKVKDLFPEIAEMRRHREKNVGLWALFHKEMGDHIRSRRFQLILALVAVSCFASIYGALESISGSGADGEFVFLSLFTVSGSSIPSFVSFIAMLGPFVGLALGFDGVNSERNGGTLNRLLSQPIYRDSVINGKFLAGAAVIFSMVFAMGGLAVAVGLIAIGIPPSLEEVGENSGFPLLYRRVYLLLAWAVPSCSPCCAATPPPALWR